MPSDLLSGKFKTSASVTDTGKKRDNNEDCVLVLENAGCYAVSDGMGGGAAGEIASSTVITYIRNAVSGAPVQPAKVLPALFGGVGSVISGLSTV